MRWSVLLAAGLAAVLVGAELAARFGLGLGTPPLSVAHPSIEYMFRPDQNVTRFGNRQLYNAFGMRSGLVPEGARVVLVLGDSVVNGGNQSDQAELATELVADRLGDGEAFVGNVSAGSWGPPNQLAYVREFGLFGAEAVVLVLSSHDAGDVPSFEPLNPETHPTRNPPLALWEGVTRYLPRFIPALAAEPAGDPIPEEATGEALDELAALVEAIREAGAEVCAVHHLERAELEEGMMPQGAMLRAALGEAEVPVVDSGPALRAAVEAGSGPYRDNIHLTASGQEVLAGLVGDCLEAVGVR